MFYVEVCMFDPLLFTLSSFDHFVTKHNLLKEATQGGIEDLHMVDVLEENGDQKKYI